MFGGKTTKDLAGSSVTIIGAGVCVNGNVAFSGYLRVHGSIVGNITCNSEPHGTVVVPDSGCVTGSIQAPNIVIGGRIVGDMDASESIEIHPNASVLGDAHYRQLAIQAGGVIDGALFPTAALVSETPKQERRVAVPDIPEIKELDGPHAHERRATDRFWTPHKVAIAAALILALAFFLWPNRMSSDAAPSVAVAPSGEAPLRTSLDMAPVPETPTEPAVATTPAVQPPSTEVAQVAPPTPTAPTKPAEPLEQPAPDPDKILTVEGVELGKPTKLFFVSTREPIVLYQKLLTSSGEGKRIEIGRRVKRRFPISEQEVIRVAQGSDLDVFYQGGKVSARIIQSGNWINFVPLVAPEANQ